MFRKPIRLVTFDVTNTLLRFRVSPGQQYTEVASKWGVQLDEGVVSKEFKSNYRAMNLLHPNFGRATGLPWDEWWRKVVMKTFEPLIKEPELTEKLASQLIESYKEKHFWLINDGCKDILQFLKDRDVSLGVISNFDPRLHQLLENIGLNSYFDFLALSYEVGFAKPSKEIFEYALAKSKTWVTPEMALHVGDNLELDYDGARAAGWQAVVVGPSAHFPNSFPDLQNLYLNFLSNKNVFSN